MQVRTTQTHPAGDQWLVVTDDDDHTISVQAGAAAAELIYKLRLANVPAQAAARLDPIPMYAQPLQRTLCQRICDRFTPARSRIKRRLEAILS